LLLESSSIGGTPRLLRQTARAKKNARLPQKKDLAAAARRREAGPTRGAQDGGTDTLLEVTAPPFAFPSAARAAASVNYDERALPGLRAFQQSAHIVLPKHARGASRAP
jgi:hypothetical protein